jgi:transposase
LYFFDEFGFNLNMTPRYARAPSGERAYARVPCNRGAAFTLVMGIGLAGIVAPCAFKGGMNGHVFGRYMSEQVVPLLPPDAIVVVDNLGAHHSEDATDALEARGVVVVDTPAEIGEASEANGIQMWFLPAYSPDMTPAEECGSKVKTLTRAAAPRTEATLYDAMGHAIGQVTPQDARGWFEHARRARAPRPRPEVAHHGGDGGDGGTPTSDQPRSPPSG